MKLIYKKYLKFYKLKLFYLKGENVMMNEILSLKGDMVKNGIMERDNKHCCK